MVHYNIIIEREGIEDRLRWERSTETIERYRRALQIINQVMIGKNYLEFKNALELEEYFKGKDISNDTFTLYGGMRTACIKEAENFLKNKAKSVSVCREGTV